MRTKFHEAYSFWELILKNNEFQKLCNTLGYMKAGFFKKNHKHANKVGHTSEFPFGIYSWTLKNLKNQNFEKMKKKKKKKKCWRYHFTHAYQKPQSYEVHFLGYGVRQKNFLSFWAIFCPLLPHFPNNPENQNFEKMKKASGDLTLNFLPFDLPLTTQRIKILKNENNP